MFHFWSDTFWSEARYAPPVRKNGGRGGGIQARRAGGANAAPVKPPPPVDAAAALPGFRHPLPLSERRRASGPARQGSSSSQHARRTIHARRSARQDHGHHAQRIDDQRPGAPAGRLANPTITDRPAAVYKASITDLRTFARFAGIYRRAAAARRSTPAPGQVRAAAAASRSAAERRPTIRGKAIKRKRAELR